jgi:hypothetical protein
VKRLQSLMGGLERGWKEDEDSAKPRDRAAKACSSGDSWEVGRPIR